MASVREKHNQAANPMGGSDTVYDVASASTCGIPGLGLFSSGTEVTRPRQGMAVLVAPGPKALLAQRDAIFSWPDCSSLASLVHIFSLEAASRAVSLPAPH